jgi:ABC-type glycerol-3-phosphate transport system permease component
VNTTKDAPALNRYLSLPTLNSSLRYTLLVKLPIFLVLLLIAFTTVYPLIFMVMNSFKRRAEYFTNPYGLPEAIQFENFKILIENYGLLTNFLNSFFVVLTAIFISVSLAGLAAFVIAKLRFRGKRFIFFLIISMLLIPGQVLLIPIYLMFARLDLINHYLSVILMYSVINLPFGVFFLTASFRGIPDELIEAAKIDGASLLRVFVSIIIPVGQPAVFTLATLNFLSMWNELLLALMLLTDQHKRMITPAVATIVGRFVTNQPLLMTGLLITALPTVIALILSSRYLIKGISAGVSK